MFMHWKEQDTDDPTQELSEHNNFHTQDEKFRRMYNTKATGYGQNKPPSMQNSDSMKRTVFMKANHSIKNVESNE